MGSPGREKDGPSTQLAEEGPPAVSLLSLLPVHQPVCQPTGFGIGTAGGPPGWTGCAKGILVASWVPCTTLGLTGDSVGSGARACIRLVPVKQQGR